MKIGESIQIDYDCDQLSVMDAVNKALEDHGLKFECYNEDHDGFDVYTLRKVDPS